MNIDNLKSALEVLLKELSPKNIGTKNQTLLINSIADLQILIKRLDNPIKTIKLDKQVNGQCQKN